MDTHAYLQRIRYQGALNPTLPVLTELCRAHLRAVPFENLDIHLGVPIRLDAASLFHKIVRRRRGGFCYELNHLFAELLDRLGYQVSLLSARVLRKGKDPGPEFDHMALLVSIEGERFLVDVGFGVASCLPLPLKPGEHLGKGSKRKLRALGQQFSYLATDFTGVERGYVFYPRARSVEDFSDMCRWHQTSPRSWFTRSLVCVVGADSTTSLIDGRLRHNQSTSEIGNSGAYLETLRQHFGLDLPRMPRNRSESASWRWQALVLHWLQHVQEVLTMAEPQWGRSERGLAIVDRARGQLSSP